MYFFICALLKSIKIKEPQQIQEKTLNKVVEKDMTM